jgi:hypothetical protein
LRKPRNQQGKLKRRSFTNLVPNQKTTTTTTTTKLKLKIRKYLIDHPSSQKLKQEIKYLRDEVKRNEGVVKELIEEVRGMEETKNI